MNILFKKVQQFSYVLRSPINVDLLKTEGGRAIIQWGL